MTVIARIEDLRRRVQKDPASIAFAQLAEEYRRAGQLNEAVEVCRAGLGIHPGYLSARVTLGRALIELGQIDDAQRELETVLKSAAENLAAIRGLAEIHHRRGTLAEALALYQRALALAPNDPDLEETVNDLCRQVAPPQSPCAADGLSFEQMREHLAVSYVPPPPAPVVEPPRPIQVEPQPAAVPPVIPKPIAPPLPELPTAESEERRRALLMIAALNQFLDAIHVPRADQHP